MQKTGQTRHQTPDIPYTDNRLLYRLTTIVFLFCVALDFPALAASCADDGFSVTGSGGSLQIDECGECRVVTNNNAADLYVPTKFDTEWYTGGSSFLENLPANVTATACASSCTITSGTTWTASGNTCTVPSTITVNDGTSQGVTDFTAPTTGSITYSCAAGVPSTSSAVCNDVDPDAFDFTDQTGVAVSTAITSNTVTINGFTGPLNMVAGANTKISKNGGAFSAPGATVAFNPGDTAALQVTSSASNSTAVTATITFGAASVDWAVTTAAAGCTTSGLVAKWDMDETAGTTAADSSGSGFNGAMAGGMTAAGATAPGIVGNAFHFTGSNRFKASNFVIPATDKGTIAFWMNPDDFSARRRFFGSSDDYEGQYTGSKITNELDVSGASGLNATSEPPTGSWTHVVMTYDGTSHVNQIYYNGGLNKQASNVNSHPSGTVNFTVGDRTGQGDYYHGYMDDFRIYDRVLTPAEISDLYGSGEGCGGTGGDTTPAAFDFTDVTGAATSTVTTSNIVHITGINVATATSISGGGAQYQICSDATCSTVVTPWTSSAGTVTNNQYVQLKLTSSASSSTAVSTTMTIGGVNDGWSVTTAAAGATCAAGTANWTVSGHSCSASVALGNDTDTSNLTDSTGPDTGAATFLCTGGAWTEQSGSTCSALGSAFDFTDVTGATAGDQYTDNTTVSGVSGTKTATVVGSPDVQISTDGVSWGTSFSFANNDTIQIRMNASSKSGAKKVAVVVIGNLAVNWEVTNACGSTSGNICPASGLVALWKFDETSGTAVADSSGNGFNGTMQGGMTADAASSPGIVGTSFHFNGGTIQVPSFVIPATDKGTIAFWINPDDISTRHRILGAKDDWETQIITSTRLANEFYTGGGGMETSNVSPVGTWTHVAMTYDKTSGRSETYIDGVLDQQSGSQISSDPSGTVTLTLGSRTGKTEVFDGYLDDVRIYDRVLDATEIADLYNGGTGCAP